MLNTISKTVSNLSQGVVTDYALYMLTSICAYISICMSIAIYNYNNNDGPVQGVYSFITSFLIVVITGIGNFISIDPIKAE